MTVVEKQKLASLTEAEKEKLRQCLIMRVMRAAEKPLTSKEVYERCLALFKKIESGEEPLGLQLTE